MVIWNPWVLFYEDELFIRAREEADEARDKERRRKAREAQNQFKTELAEQVRGRQIEQEKAKAKHAAEDVALEATFKVWFPASLLMILQEESDLAFHYNLSFAYTTFIFMSGCSLWGL